MGSSADGASARHRNPVTGEVLSSYYHAGSSGRKLFVRTIDVNRLMVPVQSKSS